jgi:hypothetical protein
MLDGSVAATHADVRREVAKKLLMKAPDVVYDDLLNEDLKIEAEDLMQAHPVGKADIAIQRAWHRQTHLKMEQEQRKVSCPFCTHETDNRDLFCELCFRPMKADDAKLTSEREEITRFRTKVSTSIART